MTTALVMATAVIPAISDRAVAADRRAEREFLSNTHVDEVAAVEVMTDVAPVRVEDPLPALRVAPAPVQLGEDVIAIGAPNGRDGAVTKGVLSAGDAAGGADGAPMAHPPVEEPLAIVRRRPRQMADGEIATRRGTEDRWT